MNPRNWTLRARLIALVVGLIAITSLVIGAVMFLTVRTALSDQFDTQVRASAYGPLLALGQPTPSGTDLERLPVGALAAAYAAGNTSYGSYIDSGERKSTLSASQLSQIEAAEQRAQSGRPPGTLSTIQIPDLGEYRVATLQLSGYVQSAAVVVGLPTAPLQKQIAGVLLSIVLLVVLAMAAAAIIGAIIVDRALRPLKRVAGIASGVARMPLERGEVELAERVPSADTNPRTEVGQVGLALNGLLDSVGTALAVRQASEAKVRAFVADASHELRTPLASIRGYAELTRRFGGELSDDVQHNIGRIESESQRMTSLVEDLLLLARLDSQRELESAEVDLSRLLVDVVSDAHAAGRDHVWDLELPDEPVLVCGDDPRLHQVFTNLLANARVHTPAGTTVTIELRRPSGDTATVMVRDSGPGIPDDLKPTLFERFVRGDSSRNRTTGSTGLGLSIVSAVVQAHHGTVSVESEPGNTTFTVKLPLYVAEPAAPAPAPQVSVDA